MGKISAEKQKSYRKALPYILSIVGIIIILRGMNLNIPYLSPKISIQQTTETTQETPAKSEVVMDCCHSKEACEDE